VVDSIGVRGSIEPSYEEVKVSKENPVTSWRVIGKPVVRSDGHNIVKVDNGGKRPREVLVPKGTPAENFNAFIKQALYPTY
jgi:hypothetical protein